ncbi:MAG: ABC transporter substrate-binding protein [Inquilinus limosus]|uniref:ABC transporter substrate-binding protein n=1 Tax=Inquilinus limosus TaxID=171674 RepID=A0A952KFJ7_9PROT|nr:ABC transporter substrate-binding protein [Inquilinus limosus]
MRASVSVLVAAATLLALAAPAQAETDTLRIAQQFGISYLPMIVAKQQKLIEAAVTEAGLPAPEIEWIQVSGGAAMNEALLSGSLDVAAAGAPPAITLWAKTRGSIDVKGIAALGSMPIYLTTSNPQVKTLADFTDKDRIALPAVKVGFQAVLLQMAAAQAFGEDQATRLDDLTVSMAHPDATAALLSGSAEVTANFGAPPFQNQQLQDPKIHRVLSSFDVLGGPHTFNVIYATGAFYDENPKTVAAIVTALDRADQFIQAHPAEAAKLYIVAESSKLPEPFVEALITAADTRYTVAPENILKFVEFQHRIGQIKTTTTDWRDLFFPPLHDRQGS